LPKEIRVECLQVCFGRTISLFAGAF
jgi:hypothetical protein